MEPSCVRQDLIPGTSRLFADYLYDFNQVRRFYPHEFYNLASFSEAAAQLEYPESRRKHLVSALREQNGDSAALDELSRPGTVAVVTGQQVGLLSGPSYTIFKALTAIRLARELRQMEIPAVPVFWLASEDHDLAEVDHVWLFNQDATPARVSVTSAVANGGPVGEVVLSDTPFEAIRTALGELPFAGEVLRKVEEAYSPGATFTAAFKTLLQEVLREFDVLFLDPLAPAVRELARPFLAGAVCRVPELLAALKARDRELADAGYHSQVHLDDASSLLFLLGEGKRTALRWQDGQFSARDKVYSLEELQERADRLSPNALLRPVMQDYLLPTVAYIGGPAEIAYMAQSQVLYEKLLARMPVIFPRNSFTLLDSRAEKLISRYGLRMTELFEHQDKVKGKMAGQLVPAGLADEFISLESSISNAVSVLERRLSSFDPTLEAAAKKSGAKMLYQLHHLSEKTAREILRRDERTTREANYLIELTYPHRRLQERFYSIMPFLAKHGIDLPQRLFDMTQISCPDHMIRTL